MQNNTTQKAGRIGIKSLTILILLIGIFIGQNSWGQILTFNFTGTAPSNNTPWALTSALNSNLTLTTGVSRGSAVAGTTTNNRFSTTGFVVTSLANAITGNNYIFFRITANSGYTLNLAGQTMTFTIQASSTGVKDCAIMTSIDGFSSTTPVTIGTTTGLSNTTTTGIVYTFGSGSQYNNIPSSSTVEFRIYGWNATAAAGTMSLNAFSMNGSLNATGGACTTPTDVSAASATNGNAQSVVSWTNGSCFDEMMVVASSSSFTTATPSGDGTAYTAVSSFTGAGTAFDGGKVVYKGTGSTATVTSLTNGTPYNFKIFTRKGTSWSSGITTSATPVLAQFIWSGNLISGATSGGSGTWDASATSNWRSPNNTGGLTTWSTNTTPSDAVFGGTAGTVTATGTVTFTAPNFNFNTTAYTLASSGTNTVTLSGNVVLGSNVNLNIAPNVNTTTPASGTIAISNGSISGTGTAGITISSAQSASAVAQRINLATTGASITVPITITSAGGTGTAAIAQIAATATGTILSSAATITNNTAIKTSLGATSGFDLTANGVISGSADLIFAAGTGGGAGIVTLNAANTYTGATIFNAANSGVVRIGVTNALPTTTNVTMASTTGNGGILDLFGNNQTIASITNGVGGGSVRNNGTADATLTINGTTSTSFGLVIADGTTNKTALAKAGSSTLTLSGINTYTGGTTITGGTLQLGAAGVLADAGAITLNGGTFSTGTAGFSETVGTLNLNGNSTIALGTGSHTLTFAASNAITWAGTTLTITGWTGSTGTSGTSGKIFVGNTNAGLTAGQLAKINFTGFGTGAAILSTGEVVPALVAPVITSLLTGSTTYGTASSYNIIASGATSFGATPLPTGATFASPTISFAANTSANNGTAYSIGISASNTAGTDNQTLSYTINKATPIITVTGANSYTGNSSPQGPATFTLPAVGGGDVPTVANVIFSYTGISGTTYGPNATQPSNGGTYKAVATFSGDANYNSAVSADFNFTISSLIQQTITFNPITTPITYGTGTFTLSATGGASGNPVVFNSGNTSVATIGVDGVTVTVVGAGSAIITASQAGTTTYAAANNVTQTLVVNPKSLSISGITASDKVYDGNTSVTINGTATLVGGGVINGDVVNLVTGANTFNNKTAGTAKPIVTNYSITGSGAGNYSLTQPTLTASITAKPLTVSGVTVTSKAFDGTVAATLAGGTLSGIVSGDVVTFVGSGVFATSVAGTGISVTSTSTLSGADAGNYSLTQPTGLTGIITSTGFTPGNVIVEQVGDGTTALSGNATMVKLLEYNTTTASQTTPINSTAFFGSTGIPTTAPFNIVETGSGTSNGYLSLSVDKTFIAVTGYNAPNATASIAASAAATYGRTIGKAFSDKSIQANGTFVSLSGNNYRSIAAVSNAAYYLGGAAGIAYTNTDVTANNTTAATSIITTNARNVSIFNNTLFASTSSTAFNGTGSTPGIYQIGSTFNSLPTASVAGGGNVLIINSGSTGSPYGYSFSPDGLTCYVADDRTIATGGGIQKWTYAGTFSTTTGWSSGGAWSLAYTLATGTSSTVGARGITVDFSGTSPKIYSTTAEGSADRVIAITDAGASSVATTLATSGTNLIFRGLAFAPNPSTATITPTAISPSSISYAFGYGALASPSSFSLNIANLTANGSVTVSVPTTSNYVLSTTANGTYTNSVSLSYTGTATFSAGNAVFIKLKTGLAIGSYNGEVISISGGGATAQLSPSGVVTAAPSLTAANATGITYSEGNGPSNATAVTVTGANLVSNTGSGTTITVTPSANYEISTTSGGLTGFVAAPLTATYTFSGTASTATVYVRLKAGLTQGAYNNENISLAGGGGTGSFTASGTVTAPVASLNTAGVTSLTGFSYVFANGPSTSQVLTVNGNNLSGGSVSISSVAGNYEFSLTNGNDFAASKSITVSSASFTQAVYVRLKAGLGNTATSTPVTDNITIDGSLLTPQAATNLTVAASGTVLPTPIINAPSVTTLSGFITNAGIASAVQTFTIGGSNLISNILITPTSTAYEVSTTSATAGFGTSASLTPNGSGTVATNTVWVRLAATATAANPAAATLNITSGIYATARTVSVTGQVLPAVSFTEVLFPQYIQGAVTDASNATQPNNLNNNRLPFAYRATLSNLKPSATYRYYNGVELTTAAASSSGAGNNIFPDVATPANPWVYSTSPSLSTAGGYASFVTDATGSYTGYFIIVPSANATRFIPGNNLYTRITLNDGAGGTSTNQVVSSVNTVKVIDLASTTGINNGFGLKGNSFTAKNFAFAYSNLAGTGRPLSGTFVESDGAAEASPSFAAFYTFVDGANGAYAMVIPNTGTATGVQRIEQRAFSNGSLVSCPVLSSDGTFGGTVNTVNPTGLTNNALEITAGATSASQASVITSAITSGTGTVTPSAGVTIPAAGTNLVACGSNATFTIAPAACYSIADVLVDGVSQGAVTSYTFSNVAAAHTITASFTLNGPYNITVTQSANGNITPAGTAGIVSAACGSNQVFTITPAACYEVSNVIVDGQSNGSITTYTFTNITAAHTITATYTPSTSTSWTGAVSTDWNDAANWTSCLPDASKFTFITAIGNSPGAGYANVTRQPTLTAAATTGDLEMDANSIVTIGANTLTVTGSYTDDGGSSLIGSGLSNLSIGNSSTFTSATILTLNNLSVTGGTTIIGSPVQISSTTLSNGGSLSTDVSAGTPLSFGTLTLSDATAFTIALGTGNYAVNFANSSVQTWNAGATLTVTGWTGSVGLPGTGGQVFFGSNASGLTATQLAQVSISGFTNPLALLSATGELVPCANVTLASIQAAQPSICTSATTTLSATGLTGTNAVVNWYTLPNGGGSIIGTGLGPITVSPGTYYALATGNCGNAVELSITVGSLSPTVITVPASPVSQTAYVNDPSPASLTLTATGTSLTYQWFSNTANSNAGGTSTGSGNGGQTNSYTPPTNVVGTKYYYCEVTGSCGTASSSAVSVTVTNTNTWKQGNATNNWSIASNWSGNAVPTGINDAVIPVGNTPYPVLSASSAINNLTIDPTATAGLGGFTLTVNGTITGTGTLSGSATSSLVTNATTTVRFTAGANTLKNLNVTGGTTTLANALSITGGTATNTYGTVTVSSGATLASNGNLTIRSNQYGTARVAAGATAGNYITGDVTVERYIPQNASRAWRLLSVPTKGTKTIKQTWQENQSANANGLPGFGTLITSNLAAAPLLAAGFDVYSTAPSVQSYTSGTQVWTYLGSTNSSPIETTKGYFLYIRGDRSVGVAPTFPAPSVSATTLRTTGTLYQGNATPAISIGAGKYEPVGNIFASAIDFTGLTKTGGISNTFYVWDAKLVVSATSMGGYQTFNGSVGFTPATPGGSYAAGVPNTTIESGEAFMLGATGSAGTVAIPESSKTTGNQLNPFRPSAQPAQFRTSLLKVNGSTAVFADNNIVVFDAAYSDAADGDDALRLPHVGESLDIVRDNKSLIIEARQPVSGSSTISFRTGQLQAGQQYRLSFSTLNMNTTGLTAFVEDSYLHSSTAINLVEGSVYSFTVVPGDAGSGAADRFSVVFRKAGSSSSPAISVTPGIVVSPNPVEGSVVHLQFKNELAGRYGIRLLDNGGKVVLSTFAAHAGGTGTQLLNLPSAIARGAYQLEVTAPDKNKQVQTIFINSIK